MRRLALTIASVLWMVGSAATQQTPHPCDGRGPAEQTISNSAPHRVQFCARLDDYVEAATDYINGVAVDLRPVAAVTGAPSSTGWMLYETPRYLQLPPGTYVLEMTVWNRPFEGQPAQESPRSDPLSFAVVAERPAPQAPRLMGVVR